MWAKARGTWRQAELIAPKAALIATATARPTAWKVTVADDRTRWCAMHRLVVIMLIVVLTAFDHADTSVFFKSCQFDLGRCAHAIRSQLPG